MYVCMYILKATLLYHYHYQATYSNQSSTSTSTPFPSPPPNLLHDPPTAVPFTIYNLTSQYHHFTTLICPYLLNLSPPPSSNTSSSTTKIFKLSNASLSASITRSSKAWTRQDRLCFRRAATVIGVREAEGRERRRAWLRGIWP